MPKHTNGRTSARCVPGHLNTAESCTGT
ncbi:unnamed protein product [Acanthoscelides obtectus]|uniref:Uncharacterized protein n=1 Tax=Acanthoscelides obtectus TaxID=200917 RepID=A0A9P0M344_ACAOB|nr:unnamed protein product [Acanthoscelides obtectus]CAK1636082.1 hypothetical protein AOBTE_LOCUS9731 [Acanthoscelides obtectus]